MRLYLIATILLITISVLSEVSAKRKPLTAHSVAGRKGLKKNTEKHRQLTDLAANFHENRHRSKRQTQPQEETPAIEKAKEDVPQADNKLVENKVQITQENQSQGDKKNNSDDSSSSESNESGQKNGKTRRSIRGNSDISDSKSDESKETQKLLAKVNKIRRSLKRKLNKYG